MSIAKTYIKSDIYRYYGKKKRSLTSILISGYQIPYLKTLRHAKYESFAPLKFIWRLKLHLLKKKTAMSISYRANIGKGLYIGHVGSIAINENVIIGDNCNITSGVVIGADNRGKRKGAPCIGNKVWVGSNAVIVGKINIGDDVLIAPNSFVNFDVPSHSLVIGNPAVIKPKENATEGFINNVVE